MSAVDLTNRIAVISFKKQKWNKKFRCWESVIVLRHDCPLRSKQRLYRQVEIREEEEKK